MKIKSNPKSSTIEFKTGGGVSLCLLVHYTTISNSHFICYNPAGIYLLKVNNRNTRTRCEIYSKLTIKTPERRQWRRSGVFIVNFEHISRLGLVFSLLTLNM